MHMCEACTGMQLYIESGSNLPEQSSSSTVTQDVFMHCLKKNTFRLSNSMT